MPPEFSPTYSQDESQEQIEVPVTVVEGREVDLKEVEKEALAEVEVAHHNMLQEEVSLLMILKAPSQQRMIEVGRPKDQTIVSGIQPRISVEQDR